MRTFLLVLPLTLAGCMDMADTLTPIVKSEPIALTNAKRADIEGTILRGFFDPEAARFRNVRIADVTLKNGSQERRVCGEVNGKNRMGGYVGYEHFGGVMVGGRFQRKDFFAPCEPW